MSKEPEQIEIEIKDDQPEKKPDDVEVVKAEEAETPKNAAQNTEDAIAKLKNQLQQERQARLNAEKRAHEMANREAAAKNEVQDSNLQLINNAIETVKQNNAILQSHYAEAMSMSDFARAAEIQNNMSTNAAKLLQLEQGKIAMESQPKQTAQQQPMHSDPVEQLASQLSPRSAEWIRKNPQFARENSKFQKMMAAHQLAVSDGLVPDSDEYFESIEETLRIKPKTEVRSEEHTSELQSH